MKIKLALLAAAGSYAMISGAFAQENAGYYGALGAGVTLENDTNDLESIGNAFPAEFDADLDLDSGVAIYGALGRYLDKGFRGELEFSTRSQQVSSIPGDGLGFAGFPNNTALGDVSASTLMVNVLKDFDLDAAGRLNPYVGVGVGAARIRSEYNNIGEGDFASNLSQVAQSNVIVVEDTEHVAAVQGLAGLTFDFRENMLLSVGYKYLQTGEFEHTGYVNGPGTQVSGEFQAHEITAGLRWNFGAPVAAAPVVAAVPQMKTCFDGSRIAVTATCPAPVEKPMVTAVDPLVVYFDYDKATLNDASRRLINAKVSEVMEGELSAVSVSGHTDTVGSNRYNQALSARRAAVVRDALVGQGIDGSIISVSALGESKPARATGDGVKEPLNRRTEVGFRF